MSRSSIITLTTDFGLADGYVGTMKGVMLAIAPSVRLVDITHEIPPQHLQQTAYVLYTAYQHFATDAVHLVVVDPGVGSARRPIALQLSHGTFVGPDNGVFSYVMAEETIEGAVELLDPRHRLDSVSHTFHGRDVFAPAAAHLAAGVPVDDLGPTVQEITTLSLPRLEMLPRGVSGEVLHIDHFGNAITSIGRLRWRGDALAITPAFRREKKEHSCFRADGALVMTQGRQWEGVHATYSDVETGSALALVGSEGHLEIAVREGSAGRELGLQPGDTVEVRW